jgi:hypothetical protein
VATQPSVRPRSQRSKNEEMAAFSMAIASFGSAVPISAMTAFLPI